LNLGEVGKVDVEVEYIVKDFDGNILLTTTEFVAIETTLSHLKTLNLPVDIAYGPYLVVVKVNYEDITSAVSASFEVVDKKISSWIYVIFVLILLIILFFIIFKKIKRKGKRNNHRRAFKMRKKRKLRGKK
jgi:uncharacterized membrane protein